MHDEIFEVLNIASSSFDHIYLSTNGTFLNRLREIKRSYPKITLGISLNSRIDKGLREFIINERPILKSLFNYTTISDQIMEFISLGIPYYLIYRDIVFKSELKDSVPFYEFIKEVEDLQRIYQNIKPLYCEGFISRERHWRCPAGSTKLSIMPDGSVYPCYLFFGFPEFKLGNIYESGLEGILEDPILDFFKNPGENRCDNTGCNIKDLCHGGCPAQSYTIYRDISIPDPRCNQR